MTNSPPLQDDPSVSELSAQIDALNEKAWKLESFDPREGLSLSRESYKLSTSGPFQVNPYKKGMADSLFNQAHFNLDCGDHHLSLSQALEALSLYAEIMDSVRQALTLRLMGQVYLATNEYNKAMDTLLKGMEIAKHLGDPAPMGEILMAIGMVYLLAGDPAQAIKEFKRSLQIFQAGSQQKLCAYAYCYLAAAYKLDGQFDIARQYLDRCESAALQLGSDLLKIDVYRQKGQYDLQQGNLQSAHDWFQKSLELAEKHGYQTDLVASTIWISDVYLQRGELEEASKLLLGALKQAHKTRFSEGGLNAHQKLAHIYEQLHDYQRAYDHLKAQQEIERRVTAEKNELKYKSIETVYRTQSMQNEARIVQSKNDQLEKEIADRRWAEEALRQSEERYRRLANLDPLTGLNNRRFFYELASSEFRRIKRYFHPLSLLMIDIDHFKRINEQFGHLAGDHILKMTARILESCLREVDILGRFGGEEFVVLLPETSLEQSIPVANRLLRLLADAHFELRNDTVQITVSIGVAPYEENCSLEKLIDHADRAMQAAKQAGRNRVSIWDEPSAHTSALPG